MNNLPRQIGQRLFVLTVLLCAFSVIYVIGCAGVTKSVMLNDWGVRG